jgi:hypothetical protein
MIGAWTTADRLDDPDSPYAPAAIESASYILWMLSGRKFSGQHTTTETYFQPYSDEPLTQRIYPVLDNGQVRNVCGICGNGCLHFIPLRGQPIISIESLTIDDADVDLAEVVIYDYSAIAPADNGCWGSCGNLEVSYTFGTIPPAAGTAAATELANQFIWAATDDERCSLPARVTSVSRQGVSWTLLDQQDFLEQGRTGIYLVDLFLRTVNPSKALMRSRVFSPDVPRGKSIRYADSSGRAIAPSVRPAQID